MNAPKSDLEPWQWPEEHWRKLVARVRAGRPLRPASWPGGARCAVALSFDSDHETSDLRDGGKSIGRLAWGQFGNRVGVPRILKLLERYDVKATFYVPAVAAALHAARGRSRHLPPRVRGGLRGARALPIDDASACHRLPLAHLDHRGADPAGAVPARRVVRDARRCRALGQGKRRLSYFGAAGSRARNRSRT